MQEANEHSQRLYCFEHRHLKAVIGINDCERIKTQALLVSAAVKLSKPLENKSKLDEHLRALLEEYCRENNFFLLESMAFAMSKILWNSIDNAQSLTLKLSKPEALIGQAAYSYVTIKLGEKT